MFALSQTSGYAIKALVHLGTVNDEPQLVRDVSSASGVPAPYLAKIVRRLAASGILHARRGHKGGIKLARPPKQISVLDIGVAIEGPDLVGNCLLGKVFCENLKKCPTHRFWKAMRKDIERELKRWTLADIIRFTRQHARRPATKRLRRTGSIVRL